MITVRLIELQRASMSYDRAYSDERKAWKKSTKERGYESSDLDIDDIYDLNKIYCEVCKISKKKNPIMQSQIYQFLLISHSSLRMNQLS